MTQSIILLKNLKSNYINDNATIEKAIKKINKNNCKTLIVFKNKKLVGTITDGDIRRGLLKNINIKNYVKDIYNQKPTVLKREYINSVIQSLFNFHDIDCIPIIDSKKFIKGVYVSNYKPEQILNNNLMVIMAGGKGSRLKNYTKNKPKPMLEINDKPILEHIINGAKNYGINRFNISINYLGKKIINYFKDGKNFNSKIVYIKEKNPLGTAGSIGLLNPKKIKANPIIVINGDVLTDINYYELIKFHKENKSFATMVISSYAVNIPYGVIKTQNLQIKNFKEKPTINYQINSGIYLLNKECIKYIKKNKYLDMTTLFEILIKKKKKVLVYPIHEKWNEIGRVKDYNKIKKSKKYK